MAMTIPATFTNHHPYQPLKDLRSAGPNSCITVKDKTGKIKEILGSNGETLTGFGGKHERLF